LGWKGGVFHTIRPEIQERMRYLEEIDARDRADGTPRMQRLRQIPPETGKFLALLAANSPAGEWLEIGTSAGYPGSAVARFDAVAGHGMRGLRPEADHVRIAAAEGRPWRGRRCDWPE
jgi:predicted O-methyltransferase YrrM